MAPQLAQRCGMGLGPKQRPLGACLAASRPAPVQAARCSSSIQPRRCRQVCAALGRSAEEDDLLLGAACPVPLEQQPMQELKQLQEMSLFDWATMPVPVFARKLATAWAGFFFALGLPVSAFTFDVHRELLQCIAAASAGSSFIVTVLVWRLYLGWQHVGDRLISATVVYEETGWYDGQTWIKTPQVLMRDRLMSNYTVKPALARLKRTLLGLGGSLAAAMLLLATLAPPAVNSAPYEGSYYAGADYASDYASAYDSQGYDDAAVEAYEPWAAAGGEEGEEAVAGRYDMRSHMGLQ